MESCTPGQTFRHLDGLVSQSSVQNPGKQEDKAGECGHVNRREGQQVTAEGALALDYRLETPKAG